MCLPQYIPQINGKYYDFVIAGAYEGEGASVCVSDVLGEVH